MGRCGWLAIAFSLLPAVAFAQAPRRYQATPAFSYSIDVRAEMPAPESITSLYVANATLQGLDAITTIQALGDGRAEANPLLRNGNRPLIIGAKIAATTVSIYLAKKLWRQNRKAAVFSMILTNTLMSMVVANNSEILERPSYVR